MNSVYFAVDGCAPLTPDAPPSHLIQIPRGATHIGPGQIRKSASDWSQPYLAPMKDILEVYLGSESGKSHRLLSQ